MCMFESNAYFRRRELQERDLAEKATSDAIRNIHLDLAKRYRELAEQAKAVVIPYKAATRSSGLRR